MVENIINNALSNSIDKLKSAENYLDWAFAMKFYLKDQDLWHCVDEAGSAYSTTITNAGNMNKAMSRIVAAKDKSIYSYIREATTIFVGHLEIHS